MTALAHTDDLFINLPELAQACIIVSSGTGEICVTMPGGTEICAQFGYEFGNAGDITQSLFAALNGGLAPLVPIFDIIDVLKKIADCLQAVPEVLTNPKKLTDCFPNLLKALEKLLALLPPFSVPIMVKRILAAIVLALQALQSKLFAMIQKQKRILALGLAARAPGNFALLPVLDCATQNFSAEITNLNDSMTPLNRLLGIVNLFLQLIGQDPIPSLASLGPDPSAALEPLAVVIKGLQTIEAGIPLP